MRASFADYTALLTAYLDRHAAVVEAIERRVLNAQDKQPARSRDRPQAETLLLGSFDLAVANSDRTISSAALAAAHAADGFQPAAQRAHSHRLDPVDLDARGEGQSSAKVWLPPSDGRLREAIHDPRQPQPSG